MSVKQQSAFISIISVLLLTGVMGFFIYANVLSGFQAVENQRVENNIERVRYTIADKHKQLNSKLADWAIWDDTYNFMVKKNQSYITSNLSTESFEKFGVDEVLFIDTKGALLHSFLARSDIEEDDFPQDIYQHFGTGSALLSIDPKKGYNNGLIGTPDGYILFSAMNILHGDGSGPSAGVMVFGTYLDSRMIASINEITQLDIKLAKWDDPALSVDFKEVKSAYARGEKTQIKIISEKTISGYIVLEDIFGKPKAIIRANGLRDITLQGKTSMTTLFIVLLFTGIVGALINYWLVNSVILKKILGISKELKDLGKTQFLSKRLFVGKGNDELEVLRANVNNMLEDIEKSQKLLGLEIDTRESIFELVDVMIVILDTQACVAQINKKGCEVLGYTREELIGKSWIENVIVPEQRESMKQKFAEIMNANMTNNIYIENSLLAKDHSIVMYGWRNTILKDVKGTILSTLSVGIDMTQKKKEEREKEVYINSLKRLNDSMVGRELKMIQLKKEIAALKEKNHE